MPNDAVETFDEIAFNNLIVGPCRWCRQPESAQVHDYDWKHDDGPLCSDKAFISLLPAVPIGLRRHGFVATEVIA